MKIVSYNSYYSSNKEGLPVYILDGIVVLDDSGRPHFTIRLSKDGDLEVSAAGYVSKFNDTLFDSSLLVKPESSGSITIKRELYAE